MTISLSPTIRFFLLVAAAVLLVWSGCVLADWVSTGTPAVLDRFAAACVVASLLPIWRSSPQT